MTKHTSSSIKRRSFLRTTSTGLGLGLLPLIEARWDNPSVAQQKLTPPTEINEAYWVMVKKQFSVDKGKIMVNSANLCPCPSFINDLQRSYTEGLSRDVSFQHRSHFNEKRQMAIEKLAKYTGAHASEIGITRNTSEGNNIVVNGLDLGPGDEVIIWDENHPTNLVAWQHRSKRSGFTVKTVSVPPKPESPEQLASIFTSACSNKTRILAFSHISNVTGIVLPAKEICHWARQRGILTLVDGAQAFGFQNLDLHDMGCTYYTGSMHKWLMGPMENGILYVHMDYIESIWPNIISAGWNKDYETVDQKFCVLGQRNRASTATVADIVDFHEMIGPDIIEMRVRRLNTYLRNQIEENIPGASFISPEDPQLNGGITIVNLPDYEPRELFSRLYENYGIAGAPMNGMRISPNINSTMKDMDRIVDALVDVSGN